MVNRRKIRVLGVELMPENHLSDFPVKVIERAILESLRQRGKKVEEPWISEAFYVLDQNSSSDKVMGGFNWDEDKDNIQWPKIISNNSFGPKRRIYNLIFNKNRSNT